MLQKQAKLIEQSLAENNYVDIQQNDLLPQKVLQIIAFILRQVRSFWLILLTLNSPLIQQTHF